MTASLFEPLIVEPVEGARARVCLIYTGGTIGMVPANPDNPSSPNLAPASLQELLRYVPGLGEQERIELGLLSLREPVDSSSISPAHWLAMAAAIEEHYDDFDGFVILHGTDTMAFTTSALSFLLNDLGKPVVVTGSQLPIRELRTDGIHNLAAAVSIAGYPANDLPCVPEVVLCFMNKVFRGNRVTKVSSASWQPFDSPNYPPLGRIGAQIRLREELLRPLPEAGRRVRADRELATNVRVVFFHPGMSPDELRDELLNAEIEGAILLSYGSGNGPDAAAFMQVVREATMEGPGDSPPLPILNVTQCPEGRVEMGLYAASAGLLEAGVASGLDMTFEAALAKLYWVLPRFPVGERRAALQRDQRGEQNEELHDIRFALDPGSTGPITSAEHVLEGNFGRQGVRRAYLRLSGLALAGEPASAGVARVSLRARGTDGGTAERLVTEIAAQDLPRCGSIYEDVTALARDVARPGVALQVQLQGEGGALSCDAVSLALYTDVRR